MNRFSNLRASVITRMLGLLFVLLLLAGCVAGPPPRAGAAPFGIPAAAPAARAALAQTCSNWQGCTLFPVDVTTATPVPGLEPLDVGRFAVFGFSPDGHTLATIAYPREGSNEELTDGLLLLTDLATWDTISTTLTFDYATQPPLFSADKRRLYLVEPVLSGPPADKLVAVDVATRKVVAELVLPFPPRRLAVTPDGSAIHLYGAGGPVQDGLITNPAAHVARVNAADLSLAWSQALDGVRDGHFAPDGSSDPHDGVWWETASLFTPDASTLYVAHADAPRLTTVEFGVQAPAVATASIAPRRTWGEWLRGLVVRSAQAKILNGTSLTATLAPDGSRLYVGGTVYSYEDAMHREESATVQVIDLPEGTALPGPLANAAYLDATGTQLFLANWRYMQATPQEWTEVVDAATLERVAMVEGWAVRPTRRLDGAPVLLGQRTLPGGYPEIALFDPATLTPQAIGGGLPGTWSMWVMP